MKPSVMVIGCLLVTSPAFAQLGSIGKAITAAQKVQSLKIGEEQELEIGGRVSEAVRTRYGVVQDAAVHRYVTLVGLTLAQASTRPKGPWQFIVLDTDGVNAFAAPGGFIFVTRGALAFMQSEAELADVLAHELMHVTEQHTVKAIQKKNMSDLGLDLAPGGGLTKAALDKLGEEATKLVLAGYGRAEELEADEAGIVLSNRIGYAPRGLGDFLTRLSERNKASTEKQGLFASHPEMKERLDRLDKQIQTQKLAGTVTLADRYKKFVTYEPKPLTDIAQVEAGSAGLVGGSAAPASAAASNTSTPPAAEKEGASPAGTTAEKKEAEPKKRGFGLSKLMGGGGEEKKSAQVVGSGGSRGVDTERNAKGGANPAVVAVKLAPADIDEFKKEGGLAAS